MKILVEGMKCQGCVSKVKSALQNLHLKNVDVDLTSKIASFKGQAIESELKEALANAGYICKEILD